eukprot:TRINITY_DN391_c0_g3_i1.p1 TRINITY_DN391_c0_g3~~TRINITY_DN391_c0_g3_i1.p1  ORF type:complete len:233 (+),score=51.61 TRINITY_DN391_c0_g3_i1:104-802(+)
MSQRERKTDQLEDAFSLAAYGEIESLRELLPAQAEELKKQVNKKDSSGATLLMEAAKQGHMHVTQFLLESQADVNASDQAGHVALHFASGGGFAKLTSFLLESKADVNTIDAQGKSALHWACSNNHDEVVNVLLLNGATASLKDKQNKPAMEWLSSFKPSKMLKSQSRLVQPSKDSDQKHLLSLFEDRSSKPCIQSEADDQSVIARGTSDLVENSSSSISSSSSTSTSSLKS